MRIFICFLLILHLACDAWKIYEDPDDKLSVLELIASKGYPAEEHFVHTDDGYILTVHRIRSGFDKLPVHSSPKPIVFLQHGLLDCSATWVVNSVNESLGYILADAGYDVWMGNVRGNTFGLNHERLSVSDPKFWDFSWDEMAIHDLPSMINYALNHTNQKDLFYIGHSQGTMIAFSELSLNQDLAKKIKLFLALGPVAVVANIESPIKYLSNLGSYPDHQLIYSLFGRKDFLPSDIFIKWLAEKVCTNPVTTPLVCDNIIFLLTGPSKNINDSRISVYTNHAPAGTSVKNLVHYAQSVENRKHQMYDYGKHNMKKYNKTTAPEYDISKVQVPVALYWAKQDWLADPTDVEYIRKKIPNIVDDFDCVDYNHLDFLWAVNANKILYERMMKLIKKYL